MQKPAGTKQEIVGLHGFRAILCLIVANYHIWQQSWLPQGFRLFGRWISYDYITRTGYMMVDGLILLSGFLLFLPHASCMVQGGKLPRTDHFYIKRLARIVPSYMLAVLAALFFIALPQQLYYSPRVMWKDLLSHLTFSQTFFYQPYQATHLNGVLWTVCIEMQLYLLFPLMASCARKKPGLTLGTMAVLGWIYRAVVYFKVEDTAMYINQMPAFLDVYALGMLGAMVYVHIGALKGEKKDWRHYCVRALSVVLLALGLILVSSVLKAQAKQASIGLAELRLGQLSHRLTLALGLMSCMLAIAFLPRPLEWLFGNRLMRFFAEISFNFYIWHHILAVQFMKHWFGFDTLHNTPGLQKAFTLLCYAVSLVVATAVTYGIEKPIVNKVNQWLKQRERKNDHEGSQTGNTEQTTDSLLLPAQGGGAGTD